MLLALKLLNVLVLLIDGTHQRGSWGKDFIHEDKDRLLRCKLDALSDNVDELADGKILIDIARVDHQSAKLEDGIVMQDVRTH